MDVLFFLAIPGETTTVVVKNVCAMDITSPSSSAITDFIATDVGGCITYQEPTVNIVQHQSTSGDTIMLVEHELPVQDVQTTRFDFTSLTRILNYPTIGVGMLSTTAATPRLVVERISSIKLF